jgi:hypothetical protein
MRFTLSLCANISAVDKERLSAIHVVNDGTKSLDNKKSLFLKKSLDKSKKCRLGSQEQSSLS